RLDTDRKYNITRDLGLNLNGTYHIGQFFFGLQINKAIIPLVSSDKKNIMKYTREIEPLSAIIATFGYSFRF
nr:hypothetical protein [Saprospiraceae bacterium]